MMSQETDGEPVFEDEFMADEILVVRLPARCAARCTVLSKPFRQLLATPHFWLRHQSLGAPLELPHAACMQRHNNGRNDFYFQFHVVGPTFIIEHTVSMENGVFYTSTCNGLVLVSGPSCPYDNVVFNPATKEEVRLSLQLPQPGKEDVDRHIIGLGYGPSSKVYKALILETGDTSTRLLVVSLDGSGDQEPRTVFSSDEDMDCAHCLHTTDGKVYFFIYPINWSDYSNVLCVLAFDVDNEAMTKIAIPEGHDISTRMMLLVHGRPCVYTEKGQDTILWVLTTDHQWEQLCILVKESSPPRGDLVGAWECGGGLLFVEFDYRAAYMYNLHEADGDEKKGSSGSRLVAVSSMKIKYKRSKYDCPHNLWGYQPSLITPASIFGDAAFSTGCRESVGPKQEVDRTFLEMTQKSVVDPMMHMLSLLCSTSG
ncbi:unnamed protein product [Alopecurus aequalis]